MRDDSFNKSLLPKKIIKNKTVPTMKNKSEKYSVPSYSEGFLRLINDIIIIIIIESGVVLQSPPLATGGMTLAREIPVRSIVIFLPSTGRRHSDPPTTTRAARAVVHELSTWVTRRRLLPTVTHKLWTAKRCQAPAGDPAFAGPKDMT